MSYQIVFDVTREGFAAWSFPAIGLLFVAIGLGTLEYFRRHPQGVSRLRRIFMYFWTGFAVMWTIGAFVATYGEYAHLRNALARGNYTVVEGEVTNYQPQPEEGHADERFDVVGHHYRFSDYVEIAGYHRSQSHGGVFRDGLRVRIADVDGQIARLEVAFDPAYPPAP